MFKWLIMCKLCMMQETEPFGNSPQLIMVFPLNGREYTWKYIRVVKWSVSILQPSSIQGLLVAHMAPEPLLSGIQPHHIRQCHILDSVLQSWIQWFFMHHSITMFNPHFDLFIIYSMFHSLFII